MAKAVVLVSSYLIKASLLVENKTKLVIIKVERIFHRPLELKIYEYTYKNIPLIVKAFGPYPSLLSFLYFLNFSINLSDCSGLFTCFTISSSFSTSKNSLASSIEP